MRTDLRIDRIPVVQKGVCRSGAVSGLGGMWSGEFSPSVTHPDDHVTYPHDAFWPHSLLLSVDRMTDACENIILPRFATQWAVIRLLDCQKDILGLLWVAFFFSVCAISEYFYLSHAISSWVETRSFLSLDDVTRRLPSGFQLKLCTTSPCWLRSEIKGVRRCNTLH